MSGFVQGPTGLPYIEKDPAAQLDYKLDWTAWLSQETIATAAFAIDAGDEATTKLEIVSDDNDDTSATVTLRAGTAGVTYTVRCRITTTSDRTDDRSFNVICRER